MCHRRRRRRVIGALTPGDDPRICRAQHPNYKTDMTVAPTELFLGAWCHMQAPAGTREGQASQWTEFGRGGFRFFARHLQGDSLVRE